MNDLNCIPGIVVSGKPHTLGSDNAGQALGTAITGGATTFGRMFSAQVEITNHTPQGLIQLLHIRTVSTRQSFERSKTPWGRCYNKLAGEDAVYVALSGHHFIQVLVALDRRDQTAGIPPKAQCGIRLDIAEDFLKRLKENYQSKGR